MGTWGDLVTLFYDLEKRAVELFEAGPENIATAELRNRKGTKKGREQ